MLIRPRGHFAGLVLDHECRRQRVWWGAAWSEQTEQVSIGCPRGALCAWQSPGRCQLRGCSDCRLCSGKPAAKMRLASAPWRGRARRGSRGARGAYCSLQTCAEAAHLTSPSARGQLVSCFRRNDNGVIHLMSLSAYGCISKPINIPERFCTQYAVPCAPSMPTGVACSRRRSISGWQPGRRRCD